MLTAYPEIARERDAWILGQRPARNQLNPYEPHSYASEEERAESGEVADVATLLLTNRECPWRCLMCDLWRNTLTETAPPGAIPAQIDYALARLPAARQIKLYNSGSFFDPRAIPTEDHPAIAERVRGFERVIVECHPALVGEACVRFRDLLSLREPSRLAATAAELRSADFSPLPGFPPKTAGERTEVRAPMRPPSLNSLTDPLKWENGPPSGGITPTLEVAMGLETVHPDVLSRLNKRMTLQQFREAAEFLRKHEIALRVFILVKPPFLDEDEALHWAKRSLDFAFECGATVASLIPTRFGNGALEALAERGEFSPPKLSPLEQATGYGVSLKRGRVFADLWDLERFADCAACFPARLARLREMNFTQTVPPVICCPVCGF